MFWNRQKRIRTVSVVDKSVNMDLCTIGLTSGMTIMTSKTAVEVLKKSSGFVLMPRFMPFGNSLIEMLKFKHTATTPLEINSSAVAWLGNPFPAEVVTAWHEEEEVDFE